MTLRMRIAHLLDRLPWTCWAELCVWALGYPNCNIAKTIVTTCGDTGTTGCKACWCGKRRWDQDEPAGPPPF